MKFVCFGTMSAIFERTPLKPAFLLNTTAAVLASPALSQPEALSRVAPARGMPMTTLGVYASRFSYEPDCVSGDDSVAFYVPWLEYPRNSRVAMKTNALGSSERQRDKVREGALLE